jgi:plasmid stabilization system protein ParE
MTYRVRLQPAALEGLDQAYRYAARNAPGTAARWFNRFYEALQTLSQNPDRCSFALENRKSKRELRQLLYGRKPNVFRAVFTLEGSTVWILRIRRAARRPLTKKS